MVGDREERLGNVLRETKMGIRSGAAGWDGVIWEEDMGP
jgi:hypothetical protein